MNGNKINLNFLLWNILLLLAIAVVALIDSTAMADPSQLLQDIRYTKVKTSDAIEIIFSEPVRYISHFPTHRSKEVAIMLDTLDREDESEIQRRVQTLPIPAPNGIPLQGVALVIEDVSKKLIVRFTEPVVFAVSQISGSTSITIVIGETAKAPAETVPPEKETREAVDAIPKTTAGAVAEDVVEKYMNAGRTALTKGNNSDAIQILSTVLSMPQNKYSQEALELLGVARERNNQIAHAKAVYQQYLKLYPEGEGAERVKQRFADLIAGQLAPREKLKPTEQAGKGFQHQVNGEIAQYYYHGENDIEEATSTADQKLLISQLSLTHRMRGAYTDIRNFIFVDHEHDFLVDGQNEDPEINSLYSKIKNSKYGLYSTIGRQSAATAGVLGRFDGVLFGYDIHESIRLNLVGGYPVDITEKTRIQTEKVFYGLNLEMNDYWKNWNIIPYVLFQEIDGISDREVVGTEIRYFSTKGNFFSTVDYDTLFSELNIFMFRGQYSVTANSVLLLTLDQRKNPLLETSNALLGDATNDSIEELLATLTEEEIIERAKDRTGDSSTAGLGLNNNITTDIQFNADITYSQQKFKIVDAVGDTTEQDDDQTYYSAQLVINKILNHQDTTIFDLRYSETGTYDETQFAISHRIPLESKLRIQTRLFAAERDNDSGEILKRLRPSLNLNYNSRHSINYLAEFSYEWWDYSGVTVNSDYERFFVNIGYQWLF
ncbi:MAG: hypothetical protein L0Z73_06110 [Gammaproteobacteria bacterium]|nr:hypothetical protein [Gammaproteobacteria bacterium]